MKPTKTEDQGPVTVDHDIGIVYLHHSAHPQGKWEAQSFAFTPKEADIIGRALVRHSAWAERAWRKVMNYGRKKK